MPKWEPVGTRYMGIILMGRWANFNVGRGTQWIPYAFRSPGSGKRAAFSYSRPQVRGGRWKIRKVPATNGGKQWKAWSDGVAKKHNRLFETQAEAFAWANLVAETYKMYDNQTAITVLRLHKANNYPGRGEDHEFLTSNQ